MHLPLPLHLELTFYAFASFFRQHHMNSSVMAKRKTGGQMDDGGEGPQQQGKFPNIHHKWAHVYHAAGLNFF